MTKQAEMFIQNFGLLVKNAEGVQKVRELILQLALQGRIGKDIQPYQEWKPYNVGKIADVSIGNSIAAADKAENYANRNDGLPYIATKDVTGWLGSIRYDNGIRIPQTEKQFRVAKAGSLLICAEGGSAGRKIGIVEQDICFGNKLICSQPNMSLVEPKFLFRIFQSRIFYKMFSGKMKGIIGGISISNFKQLEISLPNLESQIRISDQVDLMMSLCDQLEIRLCEDKALKTKAAKSTLHQLTISKEIDQTNTLIKVVQSRFHEWFDSTEMISLYRGVLLNLAYEGKFSSDDIWPLRSLGDVLSFGPKNGISPKPSSIPTAVKSISLGAITKGYFNKSLYKYLDVELTLDSPLWLENGDILIQRANSLDHVGSSAIYEGNSHEFVYPDLIMKLRSNDLMLPEFLIMCMQSPISRKYFRENSSGTSGSMPKINQSTVRKLPIPIPDLAVQSATIKIINDQIEQIKKLEDTFTAQNQLSFSLFESLLNSLIQTGPDIDPDKIAQAKHLQTVHTAQQADTKPSSDIPTESFKPHITEQRRRSQPAAPVDTKFQEAALVGAIVNSFFADGGEPIGNFRLQKAVYFARRHNADPSATADFLKKAAGPYNPSMKYSGGIAIAKAKSYITEARGRYGFGDIPGATIAELEPAVERYGYGASATWVNQHFKFKKNEEWELLATVDYAMLQVRDATPADILAYVANDPEWRPKIEKLGLTEFKIESAMLEIRALFPNGNGSA